jgi:hypothetical protein
MRKQDYLVQFIAALSANEKRYFKLFAGIQPGDKRYLRLFDALENKQTYDSKALMQELDLTAHQLSDDKYYLYQTLLKSLRSFDSPVRSLSLFRDFMDIQILMDRKMWDQALELIERALTDARQRELFTCIEVLLAFKKGSLKALNRFSEAAQLLEDNRRNAAALAELNEVNSLCYLTVMSVIKRPHIIDADEYLRHPMMKKRPEELLSIKAATCWFTVDTNVTILTDDVPKYLESKRAAVNFYRAHPQLMEIDIGVYLYNYINLAQAECDNGNYSESLKALAELEDIIKNPPAHLPMSNLERVDFYTYLAKAHLLCITSKYNEALAISLKLYKHSYPTAAHERYAVIFDIAVSMLHLHKTTEACEKTEELMQMKDDVRNDLQPYTRMIMVLCQFDMGNFETIPYFIRTVKVWLKRKKISSGEADLFFSHTYAIARAPETKRRELCLKLQQAIANGQLEDANRILNLKGWLEQKLNRAA